MEKTAPTRKRSENEPTLLRARLTQDWIIVVVAQEQIRNRTWHYYMHADMSDIDDPKKEVPLFKHHIISNHTSLIQYPNIISLNLGNKKQ